MSQIRSASITKDVQIVSASQRVRQVNHLLQHVQKEIFDAVAHTNYRNDALRNAVRLRLVFHTDH